MRADATLGAQKLADAIIQLFRFVGFPLVEVLDSRHSILAALWNYRFVLMLFVHFFVS